MRDRDLVRLYWPVELRPAFDALFGIDDAMADVVASSTQPALGAIRLAWWREALERLDVNPPPPEPRLQAAAAELLPRRITGAMLAELESGWAALLDEKPDVSRITSHGVALFEAAAKILTMDSDEALEGAAKFYGVVAAARLGIISPLIDYRGGLPFAGPFPKKLRPVTALASLAWRDSLRIDELEPQATPGRAWTLFKHRLTGRIR